MVDGISENPLDVEETKKTKKAVRKWANKKAFHLHHVK